LSPRRRDGHRDDGARRHRNQRRPTHLISSSGCCAVRHGLENCQHPGRNWAFSFVMRTPKACVTCSNINRLRTGAKRRWTLNAGAASLTVPSPALH
jgi:hypothetical protein